MLFYFRNLANQCLGGMLNNCPILFGAAGGRYGGPYGFDSPVDRQLVIMRSATAMPRFSLVRGAMLLLLLLLPGLVKSGDLLDIVGAKIRPSSGPKMPKSYNCVML